VLYDVEEGEGEDDQGQQFHDPGPASLALVAQANGEDYYRDGDNEQEQRGHELESISAPLRALGSIGGPHERQLVGPRVAHPVSGGY
jgi:hypothetical protein